jgi:hypothetical protein
VIQHETVFFKQTGDPIQNLRYPWIAGAKDEDIEAIKHATHRTARTEAATEADNGPFEPPEFGSSLAVRNPRRS